MWGALLRAWEALALRYEAIALPGFPRLLDCAPGMAGVLVRSGKTGPRQVAFVDDALVCAFLSRHFGGRLGLRRGRVFKLSYAHTLSGMRKAASHFKLPELQVSTHSCRHGGALTFFLGGVSVPTIASRGRWLSTRTLETYLRNGRRALLRISFDAEAKLRLDACSNAVVAQFEV